ncbi:hypothetical protein H8S23_13445 [Anaerofilum sp. BX8]|uniref:SGNH hydrolase-type esterase domain-containing protein n=1 Tax=Anaerofilum hominis TaxID=2763016 RepID=A0A923RHH4_9FIRM|nr:SGNH/GDSL hydrolase family protein [Anaerofilum hominis]MBC5582513.1 hypothetical protein [Anaerofilum hominis]
MNEFERRRTRGAHRSSKPGPRPERDGGPSGQNRPPRKEPKKRRKAGFAASFSQLPPTQKKRAALLLGGGVLALVAVIVLVVLLLSSCGGKAPSESGIPSSISWVENSTDLAYDKDADKIDESKYAETILAESEDAGQEYIDETLFIGDSNTARMMSYGLTSLKNDIGIISMGIQMVPTKACVYFKGYSNPVTIPEAVKIMQPRRIIITFGTNNTIGWTAETLVQQYKTALEKIHDAYPYADIIVNSIPPVHQYRDNPNITMQTIDKFNLALADMAQELGYKFLNSAEALKDEKTGFAKWDYTISDGIHLNKDAMEAMFAYFRTHSYITEDTRPKPLKSIPERKETPPDIISSDPLAVHTDKPKATATPEGLPVVFTVSDTAAGGTLEGKLEQTVAPGAACTKVKAVPKEGYEFAGWGCTVGRIEDTSNPELTFQVPGNATEKIVVTATFKAKATPSPSPTTAPTATPEPPPVTTPTPTPQPSAPVVEPTQAPVATATPEPVVEVTPTPTPTAVPENGDAGGGAVQEP